MNSLGVKGRMSGNLTGLQDNQRSTSSKNDTTRVVKILGREYPLRGAEDCDRIVRVAEYVDAKMKQIAEISKLSSHSDIAVLAALNITNELFEINFSVNQTTDDLEERAQTILMKLDESLPALEVVSEAN